MMEWIKVEDKLPEPTCSVLMTIKNGDELSVIPGFISSLGCFVSYRTGVPVRESHFSTIIAWQPLPEPFQEERE